MNVLPVGVGLGSNLGDRLENLRLAIQWLQTKSETPLLCSRIYETDPVDCQEGVPNFLNAVCEITITVPPLLLLRGMRAFERSMGRPVSYERNSPRVLDLDLLYAGGEVVQTEELTLPHPRMFDRRFVLKPLSEIRPDLVLPGQTQSIEAMCRGCSYEWDIRVFSESFA